MENEKSFSPESEKLSRTITFLGRNTEGILNDAKNQFGSLGETVVIARDGDKLEAPAGLQKTAVGEFSPDQNAEYTLLANGGTSAQLLPTVKKLVEGKINFRAFDLQRDGTIKVMETPKIPEKEDDKEQVEKQKITEIVLFLGNNTEGILQDARKQFGSDSKAMVIARENDRLQPPAGVESTTVSGFKPEKDKKYIIIANGGTSAQLLPAITKLLEADIEFEAYDLQKDGMTKVW
jgi:hypothetical protein